MTEFENWTLVINGVGVLATLAVVILAIWGERIRQHWTKPQLNIELMEPSLTTANGQKAWYYLLRISNDRQSAPASNVRVHLEQVYKKGPEGSWQKQHFSGPAQVTWRWHTIRPLYAKIGPEDAATFGCLSKESDAFDLQLYWYPNNLSRRVLPDDLTRLEFKAVSDTAESRTIIVQVAWDGEWAEGRAEMPNHLVVQEIG